MLMISSKYLKCYSDLIIEMLDKFDEEFVLYATEAIDSDNKCIRMRKVMDLDPSQEEFSYALDELIQKVETRDSDD